MNINSVLQEWLVQQTGAKRVKYILVGGPGNNWCDPDSPPKWNYKKGWTLWRNGSRKSYTPCVSDVVVGQNWLAKQFPAQYAIMRLTGNHTLVVNWEDIESWKRDSKLFVMLESIKDKITALYQSLRHPHGLSLDPDEDRLYAD